MARELPGVPVLAGRDRRVTGRMAVERFRPDVVLLDDGMQFYQLHRDVEIVMLNAERPFGNGMPMPAGILREPAGHLGRADWAILHRTTGTGAPVASRGGRLRRMAEAGRAATASYRPVAVRELDTGHVGHPSDLKGRRVAVLCALGNPKRFEATVTQLGAEITHASRLPDHAVLSDADLNTAALDAKRTGAEALIVTAKDAVKLAQARPVVPVWVLEAELVVDKMDCIVDAIEDQVRARRAPDAGLLDDAMCCAGPCRGQAEPCEGLP
jgi:tetraacyldisaccharide 4'-kinase